MAGLVIADLPYAIEPPGLPLMLPPPRRGGVESSMIDDDGPSARCAIRADRAAGVGLYGTGVPNGDRESDPRVGVVRARDTQRSVGFAKAAPCGAGVALRDG